MHSIASLYQLVGKRDAELEWFKKSSSPLDHEMRVSLLEPEASISLTRQAELLDIEFTKCPFYGSRRMKVALERDHSIDICREHVIRLMRLMGLEALYPKEDTSKPDHLNRIYPCLLSKLVAEYPNHIWGTDITYIRLQQGFCYLVALIDWYSRYVVHWELSTTLEIPFCLENIRQALLIGVPAIHNSDQGSHFTSPQYLDLLKAQNIAISMDGHGRCMDNIFTERLRRSVKYECVYLNEFATLADARLSLTNYFSFYNATRPHQALGYQTPESLYFASTLLKETAPIIPSMLSTFTV